MKLTYRQRLLQSRPQSKFFMHYVLCWKIKMEVKIEDKLEYRGVIGVLPDIQLST